SDRDGSVGLECYGVRFHLEERRISQALAWTTNLNRVLSPLSHAMAPHPLATRVIRSQYPCRSAAVRLTEFPRVFATGIRSGMKKVAAAADPAESAVTLALGNDAPSHHVHHFELLVRRLTRRHKPPGLRKIGADCSARNNARAGCCFEHLV